MVRERETFQPKEVDMNSKEAMQIMQRLKYVGKKEMSATQLRKARKEEARRFLDCCQNYPGWENRIDEIWKYAGSYSDWELEGWKDPYPDFGK